MRKICVITGTRAEYGLLYWTMKLIKDDPSLKLQLCVTGMHLSPEFGLTYQQIEKDGFEIDEKIEMLLSSDTSVGISKSMGLAIISFSEVFNRLKPDIILVLGDRFEIFSAVSAAMIAKIPVAHCSGGEATEGLIDEPIRHSITKMSHIHFPCAKEFANRIIQLGEQPANIFQVDSLGIENINRLKLLDKIEFEKSIDFQLGKTNFLVTFHPVTLENATSEVQFKELLNAIDQFENTKIIFTKPNSDTDGRIVIRLIDEYVAKNSGKSIAFISLGQLRYLSALQFMDVVIGNSSSGLVEVPSFKKATINIGDRQRGRIKADSVIDCEPTSNELKKAITKALSNDFNNKLQHTINPYGNDNSSSKIVNALKSVDLTDIIKKRFYNLEVK